jgi:tetratricopeptide (TPR) repeat protein
MVAPEQRIFSMTPIPRTTALASAAIAAIFIATGAFAAGSAPTKPTTSPTTLHCHTGQVVKTKIVNGKKVKYCAPAQHSDLSDDELYDQGRLLAKEGQYEWALDVLDQVQNKNDPKVLNYMGYANRKAGRFDVAFTYYKKALELNPDFVLAREYLGEGYVAAGRKDLAMLQLGEIAQRCGVTCEEYKDLSTAISSN